MLFLFVLLVPLSRASVCIRILETEQSMWQAGCQMVNALDSSTIFNRQVPQKSRIIKDADVENGLEDTERGKGKLRRSERVAWTYIHYQM